MTEANIGREFKTTEIDDAVIAKAANMGLMRMPKNGKSNPAAGDMEGYERGRRSVIVDQAAVDWEGWDDPTVAVLSAVRWKLLIDGERGPSGGLVTGVAEVAPGRALPRHHHEPEETYYVLSGRGEVEIEDVRTEVGPGTAVFIPPAAEHALHCIGTEPLVFLFTFARDRFEDVAYHFDAQRRRDRADRERCRGGGGGPPPAVPRGARRS